MGSDQRSESDLKLACGLWIGEGKKGRFFKGKVMNAIPAGTRLLVFKNEHKKVEKDPDYKLFWVDETAQEPAPAPQTTPESDIPF